MSTADEKRPNPPDKARLLEVGEIINDGDLHWNTTVKHWVSVSPQGEEKVEPGQQGFYCRKNDEL
jgi:hypothetical protein